MAKSGTAVLEARYGAEQPYSVSFTLRGLTPLLFNQFVDLEGYAESTPTPKRNPNKKLEKNYEEMVFRCDDGTLGLPVHHVLASMANAGRYYKSPIASNGGAKRTLEEALTIAGDDMASFGVKMWDSIDFRLARNSDMKRSPKPTHRPRLEKGWTLSGSFSVVSPEFYAPTALLEILTRAGQVCGVGDGRKIGMGRFAPDGFEITEGIVW